MTRQNEPHCEVFLVNAENPSEKMRCWLPASGLRVGMKITLKDFHPEITWLLEEVGATLQPRSALNKEWHVGGL
jgi:hypothetical protein